MPDDTYHLSIDGRLSQGRGGVLDVVNPANGQVFAQAPIASQDQLEEAVAAARCAYPAWSARPMAERRTLVRSMGEVLRANLELLKRLLTREQGKPEADAAAEVLRAAAWCEGVATLDLPVSIREDGPERQCRTRRVPIGVVGAIAPWNSPLSLAMWKIAPAVLAGNTVVAKPSPFTPLTTLRFGELVQGILPRGVLNILSGDERLGPWMTTHPGIDKISFTGSVAVGKKVMEGGAATLKRLTLELGGNDPGIVLPDVDVERIVPDLFWAAFRNSGQVCIATKRLYVHADVYDAVAKAMVDFARGVRMGDGAEPGVQLGPVQNRPQYDRLRRLIDDARADGLRFLTGGDPKDGAGYFVPVTIVDNPPDDALVVTEEAFGPVLPMLKFHDLDEVIQRANATPYGLGATVWARDEATALCVAKRLDCGTVWINEAMYVSPFLAFGGHRNSGIGVENGHEGLLEYTNAQSILVRRRDTGP